MSNLPKCRVLWIVGTILIGVGAWVHAHGDGWSEVPYPPSVDPSGKAMYQDPSQSIFYQDVSLAMMGLGGFAASLGLIAWIYPPR